MTVSGPRENLHGHVYMTRWLGLTAVDGVGEWTSLAGASDRSLHVWGAFDSAVVTLEGSNEDNPNLTPGNEVVVKDAHGDPLTFSATGGQAINENYRWYRIKITTAGAGSENINAHMMSRSTTR